MYRHPRSIVDKVFEVWRSPGRFTKNPDIVQLPSGRILLIYSDNDSHWSQENQILTLLASDDQGKTWFKHRAIAEHDLRKGQERLVTPRLSLLADSRLVVLIDQDDFGHFHEDQPAGILAAWSSDGGDTWTPLQATGIMGFEPDRMIELPNGELAIASHIMRGETQEFADILSCSADGGKTWREVGTIAYDGFQRYCEGAIVLLDGGKELACVLRDNHHAGYPSWVAFSGDMGRTWSKPAPLPFSGDRPYGKQLADGRTLITFRNQNGPFGCYAWCGDLKRETGYQIGGPRIDYAAHLTPEALVIENKPGTECRYVMLPPESCQSEIVMEATLKVEGPAGERVAFMSVARLGGVVGFAADRITVGPGVDRTKVCDMTRYRTVTLRQRRGLAQVLVDGELLISAPVYKQEAALGVGEAGRTQFGQLGEVGKSYWRSFSCSIKNRTQGPFAWSWQASAGLLPDDYARRRLIQIHANAPVPEHGPDHGYSSWLVLPDGRILFVDYTNFGDPANKSHLVGAYIDAADIA